MSLRKVGTCEKCKNAIYGDEYGPAGHDCPILSRTTALSYMLDGRIVKALEPLYKTAEKHGGEHLFRYNITTEQIEYKCLKEPWRESKRAFWDCCFKFELVKEDGNG